MRSLAQDEKKRKYVEIINQEDEEVAREMIQEEDPMKYVFQHLAVESFLAAKKRRKVDERGDVDYVAQPWMLPTEMEDWKRMNIDCALGGRKKSLLVIGGTRLGKSEWAKSFGKPIDMEGGWSMKEYFEGATHCVVDDCRLGKFGWDGAYYWEQVIGCQTSFIANDKNMSKRRLNWNIPCVWLANEYSDPWRNKNSNSYVEGNCIVVVLTGRLY